LLLEVGRSSGDMVSGDSGRGLNESSEILLAQTTTNQIYDTAWWFNAAVWHQQGKQYWILIQ